MIEIKRLYIKQILIIADTKHISCSFGVHKKKLNISKTSFLYNSLKIRQKSPNKMIKTNSVYYFILI